MKMLMMIAFTLSGLCVNASPLLAAERTSADPKPAVSMSELAPADRYFGPLQMSVLGISNALALVARRQTGGDITDDTIGSLAAVELAIRDWERQFPKDPWIVRSVLALHKTYAIFPDPQARARAVDAAVWLVAKYPESNEARELRMRLARAFVTAPAATAGGAAATASCAR